MKRILFFIMSTLSLFGYGAQKEVNFKIIKKIKNPALATLSKENFIRLLHETHEDHKNIRNILHLIKMADLEVKMAAYLKSIAGNAYKTTHLMQYQIIFTIDKSAEIALFSALKYASHDMGFPEDQELILYEAVKHSDDKDFAKKIRLFAQMKAHHKVFNEYNKLYDEQIPCIEHGVSHKKFTLFLTLFLEESFLRKVQIRLFTEVVKEDTNYERLLAELKDIYNTLYKPLYQDINYDARQLGIQECILLKHEDFAQLPLIIKKLPEWKKSKQPLVVDTQNTMTFDTIIFPWKKINPRVTVWFEDLTGKKAFSNVYYVLKYPQLILDEVERKKVVHKHTFSRVLDTFIVEMCPAKLVEPFKCYGKEDKEPFWLLAVPAFLLCADASQQKIYISYAISQKGILFHRCFSSATCFDNETKYDLDKKLQDSIDYGADYMQHKDEKMLEVKNVSSHAAWHDDHDVFINQYMVRIFDARHNVTICIPRLYSDDEIKETPFYKKYQKRSDNQRALRK